MSEHDDKLNMKRIEVANGVFEAEVDQGNVLLTFPWRCYDDDIICRKYISESSEVEDKEISIKFDPMGVNVSGICITTDEPDPDPEIDGGLDGGPDL